MSRAGSVKRVGSTWGFVVDAGRAEGHRQQIRKRGFRTKRDAQEALTETLATVQRGMFVRPRKVTLVDYLDGWMDGLAIAGRRPSTIAGYRQLLRIHVIPAIGDIRLQDLTAMDLDALYAQLHTVGSPGGRGRSAIGRSVTSTW